MELKEMIKVMQHYENGGSVEVYKTGRWVIGVNPIWDWDTFEYRIKEEKQKVTIEKWLCRATQEDYVVIESSNIDKHKKYEKVKLIESYEVEL